MGGCGPHCRRAGSSSEKEGDSCVAPKEGVVLDKSGKCPCGKGANECCHKDTLLKKKGDVNPAVYELCKPHGLRHLCGG